MGDLTYVRTAELPDLALWLLDDDGNLVDFSSGYTFEFKIGFRGKPAIVTKTTGITGAAGSGTEVDGVPNVTIAFDAGELDDIPALASHDHYQWQLRGTTGGRDRIYQGDIKIADVIQ